MHTEFQSAISAGRAAAKYLLPLLLLVATGCAPEREIETDYGRVRGNSINGLSVLAGMYEEADCDVDIWHMLSPRLNRCECIVWAPDSFSPPSRAERKWFEKWLEEPGRTLVYIGRDYDAAVDYWNAASKDVSIAGWPGVERGRAVAQARFAAGRAKIAREVHCDWFIRLDTAERGLATRLHSPHSHWDYEIDKAGPTVALNSEIVIPTVENTAAGEWNEEFVYETLLANGKEPLVLRIQGTDKLQGQIIVVPNGSFLLNWPLIESQNRRLAGKLIDECLPTHKVVFLESKPEGLTITDREITSPTGLEVLTEWPLNVILLHGLALGILFCFAWWPIFGRPRDLPPPPRSDFRKHIVALGKLLSRTGDTAYAARQIEHYHRHVRRDSGARQTPETPPAENAGAASRTGRIEPDSSQPNQG